MTYQEKVAIIKDGQSGLENGSSWDDFQTRLASIPNFYQREIDATGIKVITALEAKYGNSIEQQLTEKGTVDPIEGLHESVSTKLVDRKTIEIRNSISARITRQILEGGDPKTVLRQNQHSLLTEKVAKNALASVERKVAAATEEADGDYNALKTVIYAIIIIVKLSILVNLFLIMP